MIEREKKQYGRTLPARMEGGPNNPLGARALYLFQGKKDTLYRIHGTNAPHTIGTAQSSGCIRMLNEEVIDLHKRVRSRRQGYCQLAETALHLLDPEPEQWSGSPDLRAGEPSVRSECSIED
jgi:hypothetical protein